MPVGLTTITKNKTKNRNKADLEYDTDSSGNNCDDRALKRNLMFDRKNDNTTDDNESEIDSLFEYDGSEEGAAEEDDDSDISMYST